MVNPLNISSSDFYSREVSSGILFNMYNIDKLVIPTSLTCLVCFPQCHHRCRTEVKRSCKSGYSFVRPVQKRRVLFEVYGRQMKSSGKLTEVGRYARKLMKGLQKRAGCQAPTLTNSIHYDHHGSAAITQRWALTSRRQEIPSLEPEQDEKLINP
jgi:hypothetical protein